MCVTSFFFVSGARASSRQYTRTQTDRISDMAAGRVANPPEGLAAVLELYSIDGRTISGPRFLAALGEALFHCAVLGIGREELAPSHGPVAEILPFPLSASHLCLV